MNGQDSKAEIFDVFLCHNSEDKPAVREIAQMLVKEGIKPWLDDEQIRPGTTWQKAFGEQIESINSAAVFVGDGGLGPWQDQEMQSFLNRFVSQKCAVIPVILDSAKATPELPWPLANLHCVDFRSDTYPLKRLVWGITGKKPQELVDAAYSEQPATMREATKSRLVPGKARIYKPLAIPPDEEQASQLKIFRDRVVEYWIDGVLKHSLYNEVLISLGKRQIDKAIDAPWKYTVELSDATNSTPLDDRDLSVIYDATGLVLILGEPGAGKTTTLLDLARILLERARDDIKERVAVVLNLSSWKKQPLAEWISIELSQKYRVPRKIGRLWLQRGYLLPLLDGLDEIEVSMQSECVTAINVFIEEFQPSGLVVCCRLNEYRWLPKRLKLNGAICLEPLSSEEVSKYLAESGPKLAALREAVDTDPVLQELAQTPLMLSIMSLACQGTGGNELAGQEGDSPEKRRNQIFRLYVEQMFHRKGMASLVFPKEKIIGWLSWLAGKMREHSQSAFLVEGLQPSWLGTKAKRVAYRAVAGLSLGLIVGLCFGLLRWLSIWLGSGPMGPLGTQLLYELIGWLPNSWLIGGPIVWFIIGLMIGLIGWLIGGPIIWFIIGGIGFGAGSLGSLEHIALVETMSWNWSQFWKKAKFGLIFGLSTALILGLIFGLGTDLNGGLSGEVSGKLSGTLSRLISGLIFWLTLGLVAGLVAGFTDRVMEDKASPNQGIKLSLKNSLIVFLVTSLMVGLSSGLIVGVLGAWSVRLTSGLSVGVLDVWSVGLTSGLVFGLIGGLVAGLSRGGSAVIKHYTLRLILWWKEYTPLKFVKFLDQCARLTFLKKVGGSYIFIHRMLLDYFAELTPSKRGGDVKTGKVGP